MKKLLKCRQFFDVCGASLIFFPPLRRCATFEHLARRDEQERAACTRQDDGDLYHRRGPLASASLHAHGFVEITNKTARIFAILRRLRR